MTDTYQNTGAPDSLSLDNPAVVIEYTDFFGFGSSEEFIMPDGHQKIFFKVMCEGERKKYQQLTNRDIRFNQATKDAHIKGDPAGERWSLITSSVTGWSLKRRNSRGEWTDVPFSSGTPGAELEKWLERADPKIVDNLEFKIRMANSWMQGDMTVEEIDKEFERLTELRVAAVERERGESGSSGR